MALAVIASFDHGSTIRTRRPGQTPRFRASWLRTRAIWGARSACPTRRAVRRAGPTGDGWRPESLRAPPPDALRVPQGSPSGAPNQRPAASLPALCLASCGDCVGLSLLMTSSLSVGVAREDEGERPNGRVGWPRESRSVAPNSARLRDRASVTVKLQAEVPHAGPARTRYSSPDPAPHRSSRTLSRS
jgi:hypothetical protein